MATKTLLHVLRNRSLVFVLMYHTNSVFDMPVFGERSGFGTTEQLLHTLQTDPPIEILAVSAMRETTYEGQPCRQYALQLAYNVKDDTVTVATSRTFVPRELELDLGLDSDSDAPPAAPKLLHTKRLPTLLTTYNAEYLTVSREAYEVLAAGNVATFILPMQAHTPATIAALSGDALPIVVGNVMFRKHDDFAVTMFNNMEILHAFYDRLAADRQGTANGRCRRVWVLGLADALQHLPSDQRPPVEVLEAAAELYPSAFDEVYAIWRPIWDGVPRFGLEELEFHLAQGARVRQAEFTMQNQITYGVENVETARQGYVLIRQAEAWPSSRRCTWITGCIQQGFVADADTDTHSRQKPNVSPTASAGGRRTYRIRAAAAFLSGL